VTRRAHSEAWEQGKCKHLADRKTAAIKEIISVEDESKRLPATFRHTIDTLSREQLEESGAIAALGVAIARKGLEILRNVETPEELEIMARAKRHLTPPPVAPAKGDTTTVNVQANAQAAAAAHEPRPRPLPEAIETMRRLLRGE
jgi:hypothetical protein